MELRNSEQPKASFRKTEQAERAGENTEENDGVALASVMLDEALKDARMSNQDVAYWLSKTGPEVSESLVQKWRKPTERACPSLAQLLRMPPHFHIAFIKQMDSHFGLGRAVLGQVQQALGTLSLLVR